MQMLMWGPSILDVTGCRLVKWQDVMMDMLVAFIMDARDSLPVQCWQVIVATSLQLQTVALMATARAMLWQHIMDTSIQWLILAFQPSSSSMLQVRLMGLEIPRSFLPVVLQFHSE